MKTAPKIKVGQKELRDGVMRWALKKRTEGKKTMTSSGMDIDAVMKEVTEMLQENQEEKVMRVDLEKIEFREIGRK